MSSENWDLAIELECIQCKEICSKTVKSKEMYESGKKYLPGGVASGYFSQSPYPIYFSEGSAGKLKDIDDNEYIDLSMCLGALVVGHNNEKINTAIINQTKKSILLGGTSPLNVDLANRLSNLYKLPSWRFMNSGTEATRDAIQISRAIKQTDEIIKIEGAYHGQHESVCVSYHPDLSNHDLCGSETEPKPVASHPGIPNVMNNFTHVIPFNCSKEIIEKQIENTPQKKVACIILEPILMNCAIILPNQKFLQDLRDICNERDIFLIFDEVKTNTTTNIGGATQLFNIIPDMICLGKSCSGGIPFGAVGMNHEIAESVARSEPSVNSTFGGNPLVMCSCLATLNEIMIPESYNYIENLQNILKEEILKLLNQYNIIGTVSFIGAKGCLIFMDHVPTNYRDWKINNCHSLDYVCHTFLLNHGIFLSGPGEEWTLSVQHTTDDVMKFINVLEKFFTLWNSSINKN